MTNPLVSGQKVKCYAVTKAERTILHDNFNLSGSTLSALPDRQLVRALTLVPAAALILANVIGTGVFVKARVMTCNVGSPEMVLTVWLVAGVLSLAGALVYAELSTMMPRPGGEFHFLGAAFGPRWAFLYGWTKTISLGASAAAVAILCLSLIHI